MTQDHLTLAYARLGMYPAKITGPYVDLGEYCGDLFTPGKKKRLLGNLDLRAPHWNSWSYTDPEQFMPLKSVSQGAFTQLVRKLQQNIPTALTVNHVMKEVEDWAASLPGIW